MRKKYWQLVLDEKMEGMKTPSVWFPIPAIISFGFFVVYSVLSTWQTNPRIGNRADIIPLTAPQEREGSIWISMIPMGDEIILTTDDQKTFRWPVYVQHKEELQEIIDHLKKRVFSEIISSALKKDPTTENLKVILAVDQRLKFVHLRPIVIALAEAKITNYAFETNLFRPEQPN